MRGCFACFSTAKLQKHLVLCICRLNGRVRPHVGQLEAGASSTNNTGTAHRELTCGLTRMLVLLRVLRWYIGFDKMQEDAFWCLLSRENKCTFKGTYMCTGLLEKLT